MHSDRKLPHGQRGAILAVSLLLLLVMTVLGLTASQATLLQERMAGNDRELDLAFQAGEAGLRGAEKRIDSTVGPKGQARYICSDPDSCDAEDRANATEDYTHQEQKWWDDNAHSLGLSLAEVGGEPQFVTEEWANVQDTLTTGDSGAKSGTIFYVNTSRALGPTATAVAIVETTYAVRY
jgi:type IV pilus assembly protein PilX